MMSKKVYSVLINYNGANDTLECVESLLSQNYFYNYIIVIDNLSSKEDCLELSRRIPPNIKFIKNNQNLGFSGGCNVGINYALDKDADFILLINNDTSVDSEFLKILVDEAEKDNDAGILVPKINYYNSAKKIWAAGGKISKIRSSGFSFYENVDDTELQNKYITFASGCCMLIKREVFANVGLWDENYFLYVEDVDFCYRVLKNGYKIKFINDSKIYHKVNATTKKNNISLPLYYTTRNRLYFAKKMLGKLYFFPFLYLTFSMFLKFPIWLILKKQDYILVVLSAFKDFKNKKFGKKEFGENS